MKKLAMFLGVLALMVVFSASQTGAALLGIKARYEGFRPDIDFNNTGMIKYTYDSSTGIGLFTLTATDEKLVLPDGTVYWLSGKDYTTQLTLGIYVDNTGKLVSGVSGYDMVEKVIEGSVTVGNVTYTVGDVLLQAEVKAFGWGYTNGGSIPAFDFIFDTVSGGLVNQGLWPSPTPATAAWVETQSGTYSWDSDFTLKSAKGDKMVTPEPSSLLLLGSGLLGFGAFFRARFGRKKKD